MGRGDAHGARLPCHGQAGGLGQAEDQVGVLHGLAGGALDQVVQRGHHDGPAAVGVGGHLQVHAVAAQRRGRRRPGSLGQHVHERLARRRPRAARPAAARRWRPHASRAVLVARMPRGIGASTGVNDSVTSTPAAAVSDCSISGVCWCTPPALYVDRAPMTSLACRCCRGGAAGARRTGGGDHDDVGRLDQAGCEQRREGQRHRRGVAARVGHPARTRQRGPGAGQLGQPVGPAAGVRAAVVGLPGGRAGEPEVGAEVDDRQLGGQLRRPARRTARAAGPGRPGRRRPARPARSGRRWCRRAAAAAGAAR